MRGGTYSEVSEKGGRSVASRARETAHLVIGSQDKLPHQSRPAPPSRAMSRQAAGAAPFILNEVELYWSAFIPANLCANMAAGTLEFVHEKR